LTSFWAKASTPERRELIHRGIYQTTGSPDATEQWQHDGESEPQDENQAYAKLEEVRKPVFTGAEDQQIRLIFERLITSHYLSPDLIRLLTAANLICEKRPAIVLRVVAEGARQKLRQRRSRER
jgi:hypothetical protein